MFEPGAACTPKPTPADVGCCPAGFSCGADPGGPPGRTICVEKPASRQSFAAAALALAAGSCERKALPGETCGERGRRGLGESHDECAALAVAWAGARTCTRGAQAWARAPRRGAPARKPLTGLPPSPHALQAARPARTRARAALTASRARRRRRPARWGPPTSLPASQTWRRRPQVCSAGARGARPPGGGLDHVPVTSLLMRLERSIAIRSDPSPTPTPLHPAPRAPVPQRPPPPARARACRTPRRPWRPTRARAA